MLNKQVEPYFELLPFKILKKSLKLFYFLVTITLDTLLEWLVSNCIKQQSQIL